MSDEENLKSENTSKILIKSKSDDSIIRKRSSSDAVSINDYMFCFLNL